MIFALALGVAFSNGNVARVEITHQGPPVPVQIVALDDSNNEIQVSALPERLTVGKGKARRSRILIPSNATALCAVYQSPSARLRSCSAQLNLLKRNSSARKGTKALTYPSILRRALDALQGEQTELTLQLSAPRLIETAE